MPGLTIGSARKALSIGVRYTDTAQYSNYDSPDELMLTHRDTEKVEELLTKFYGYKEEDIVIMKDDGKHTLPTRENILKGIDELIKDAKRGDRFVFHFSGHGSQIPDESGDEEDGLDEIIFPVDVHYDGTKDEAVGNYIVDDELRYRLVDALPAGTQLTIILDSCHSGTGCDLTYSRCGSEEEIDKKLHDELWSPITPKGSSVAPFSPLTGKAKDRNSLQRKNNLLVQEFQSIEKFVEKEFEEVRSRNVPDKLVTCWAACVDSTLTLEPMSGDGGLFTTALWHVLHQKQALTNEELYIAISEYLIRSTRPGKKQVLEMELGCPKPVLSSLHKLDDIYPLPFSF